MALRKRGDYLSLRRPFEPDDIALRARLKFHLLWRFRDRLIFSIRISALLIRSAHRFLNFLDLSQGGRWKKT
jgi:hypothetical protein